MALAARLWHSSFLSEGLFKTIVPLRYRLVQPSLRRWPLRRQASAENGVAAPSHQIWDVTIGDVDSSGQGLVANVASWHALNSV